MRGAPAAPSAMATGFSASAFIKDVVTGASGFVSEPAIPRYAMGQMIR